jgi:hypothetical protein
MNSKATSNDRDAVSVQPTAYPMLARVVRHGDQVTAILVLATLLMGGGWAWSTSSLLLALTTPVVAAGVYVLARIGVEMVRLVCDMLLPK